MRLRKLAVAAAVAAVGIGLNTQPASADVFDGCASNVIVYFGVESTAPGAPSKVNTNISQCNLVWAGGGHAGRGYISEVFVVPPGATHMSASKFTGGTRPGDGPAAGRVWATAYRGIVHADGASTPEVVTPATVPGDPSTGRANSANSAINPTNTSGQLLVQFSTGGNAYQQVVGSVTDPYVYCGNTRDIIQETTVDVNCNTGHAL